MNNNELEQNKLLVKNIIYSSLNIECDDIVMRIDEELDISKLESWLGRITDTIKTKTNIKTYFRKAFTNELKAGTFKVEHEQVKVGYLPAVQPLLNAMRDKGYVLLADDTAYMTTMFEELLNTYEIPNKELVKLNNRLLDRCADYTEYVEQLKIELTGYKINWAEIKHKAEVYIATWNWVLAARESYD